MRKSRIICPYCKYDFEYETDSDKDPFSYSDIAYCTNCDQRMVVDIKWKLDLQITKIQHNVNGELNEDRSF